MQTYSRREWIEASDFLPLQRAEIFQKIYSKIEEQWKVDKNTNSVVLLDLDSTLYEVEHRTHQILQEWAGVHQALFPRESAAVQKLTPADCGYSIRDTFSQGVVGPVFTPAEESAHQFWIERFFSDHYLPYDRPYPGAVDFVQELHRKGAQVVYLTGRDEPNMRRGTISNFMRDQFPWDTSATHLWMKATREDSDVHHKQTAAAEIVNLGKLVASFENEPHNLMTLAALYPEAMHVFMDSRCSTRLSPPGQGLYIIKGFVD